MAALCQRPDDLIVRLGKRILGHVPLCATEPCTGQEKPERKFMGRFEDTLAKSSWRKAGAWQDFATGECGDLIDLLHERLGSMTRKGTANLFFAARGQNGQSTVSGNAAPALAFRLGCTRMSSTSPLPSTARHNHIFTPLIGTTTSSRCHVSAAAGRSR